MPNDPAEVTILFGFIKLPNQYPMVYCVVRRSYCNDSSLATVFNFNMLG